MQRDSVKKRKLRAPGSWTWRDLILKNLAENSSVAENSCECSSSISCTPSSYTHLLVAQTYRHFPGPRYFFLTSAHHVPSFLKVLLPFSLFVFDLWHDPQGLDPHPHSAAELFGIVHRLYKGRVSPKWVPRPKPRASLLTDLCPRQQVAVIC